MIKYCKEYWSDIDITLKVVPNLGKLRGSSIFITGGTGMVCSSVIDLLLRLNKKYNGNIRIILGGRSLERICQRFEGFQYKKDFDFIYYDAVDYQQPNIEADYIIHGASNANPTIYTKEPVETMLANIVGLNNLLSLAKDNNIKRVLYISSSEVYGKKEGNHPYKEEDYGIVDILNSRAAYPSSKRAAETLCIAYKQQYKLDTVIVRPGHIYGPTITDTDSRASAQFTRDAAKGKNIIIKSAGTQLRSYCYTLDCAAAILTVLINGKCGDAYNISNRGSVVSISELAKALADASGVKVVFENPSEEEEKGYNLMDNSSLDAAKLEKLGWKAIFGLKEGARKTVEFYESCK